MTQQYEQYETVDDDESEVGENDESEDGVTQELFVCHTCEPGRRCRILFEIGEGYGVVPSSIKEVCPLFPVGGFGLGAYRFPRWELAWQICRPKSETIDPSTLKKENTPVKEKKKLPGDRFSDLELV